MFQSLKEMSVAATHGYKIAGTSWRGPECWIHDHSCVTPPFTYTPFRQLGIFCNAQQDVHTSPLVERGISFEREAPHSDKGRSESGSGKLRAHTGCRLGDPRKDHKDDAIRSETH